NIGSARLRLAASSTITSGHTRVVASRFHGTGCQRHRSRDRDSRARRRHVGHPRYEGALRVPRRVQESPAVATLKRRAFLTKEEAQELSEYVEQLRPQDLGKGRSGP